MMVLACSGSSDKQSDAEAANANATAGKSTAMIEKKEIDGNTLLRLNKSALNQEFLLQSAYLFQKSDGDLLESFTSESSKSRVVQFERQGDFLLMLDVTGFAQAGDEMPQHALITKFPIIVPKSEIKVTTDTTELTDIAGKVNNPIAEKPKTQLESASTEITFDFNAGMSFMFFTDDMYSDYERFPAVERDMIIPAHHAYIRKIQTLDDALMITQTLSIIDGGEHYPMEVIYYLLPYAGNANFEEKNSPGFSKLGYFEINPLVRPDYGEAYTLIEKWDISKPITYYISRDMPEHLQHAAMDGVLYWNKAFGRDVLSVELAPEGISAPHYGYNIIQYHTNRYDGSAYADFHSDPRTGEINHAQIYISSGMANLNGYVYYLLEDAAKEDAHTGSSDTGLSNISAMHGSPKCRMDARDYAKGMQTLDHLIVEKGLESRRQDIIADWVRGVIAHEVGHTLGLRHNFAASTVSPYSREKISDILHTYLATGTLSDDYTPTVNSMMDYAALEEDVLVGRYISQADTSALSYDRYAIEWGYLDGELSHRQEELVFCTDFHTPMFSDCNRFDSGKHILASRIEEIKHNMNTLARYVYMRYLTKKTLDDSMWRESALTSTNDIDRYARDIIYAWEDALALLGHDFALKSILDQFPDYSSVDEKKLNEAKNAWLLAEIVHAGGLDAILELLDPILWQKRFEEYPAQFDAIVTAAANTDLYVSESQVTKWTHEEVDYMKARARELFTAIDVLLVGEIHNLLLDEDMTIRPFAGIEKLEHTFAKWITYVLTADGDIHGFRYPLNVRKDALQLLSKSDYPGWMQAHQLSIALSVRLKLERLWGVPVDSIDITAFPRDKQNNMQAELDVYEQVAN